MLWDARGAYTAGSTGYAGGLVTFPAMAEEANGSGAKRTVRPTMIFFTQTTLEPKVEAKMFVGDTLLAGARVFNRIKVYADDIQRQSDRDLYSKVVPAIVFLDARGHEVTRLNGGEINPMGVVNAMEKTANVEFRETLQVIADRYLKFLNKFDDVREKVTTLEAELRDHEAHFAKHACETSKRNIKENTDDLVVARANLAKLSLEEPPLLAPAVKKEREIAPAPAGPAKTAPKDLKPAF